MSLRSPQAELAEPIEPLVREALLAVAVVDDPGDLMLRAAAHRLATAATSRASSA